MNTKLHAICDSNGLPLDLFVTAGRVSDYLGTWALLGGLPKVAWLLGIEATMPTGSDTRCKTRGYAPVSLDENSARKPSNTTSTDTNGATASRSCSAGSRIGGAWQPAMTVAHRSSCRPSLSPQPSFIGYEVL